MLGISFATPLKRTEQAVKPFFILEIVGGIAIYGMIFPFMFGDIVTTLFQEVNHAVIGTSRVSRSEHINFSRAKLAKLNILQKIGCVYCDYANGVIAYIKAVVNLNFEFENAESYGYIEQAQEIDITI